MGGMIAPGNLKREHLCGLIHITHIKLSPLALFWLRNHQSNGILFLLKSTMYWYSSMRVLYSALLEDRLNPAAMFEAQLDEDIETDGHAM